MSEIQKIKSFLDSMEYGEKKSKQLSVEKGKYPFITISRQAGAGGRSLAKALLEVLQKENSPAFQGWQIFDQELCQMVCNEPGLTVPLHSLINMECRSQIEDMVAELMVGDTPQDVVHKKIFDTLRNLATLGKVILVGRGGCCLTRQLPLGVHIRLVASLPSRIQRMMKLLNLPEKKAKEMVQEQDKARAKLLKDYFNKDINDPLIYDVTWNTDTVPLNEIANAIVGMLKQRPAVTKR